MEVDSSFEHYPKEEVNTIVSKIKALIKRQDGQTMAEYGIILVVIALVGIIGATLLGGDIKAVFESVAGKI